MGSGRGQITAYPRQLESLIRLAEAHAKMRFSNSVELPDVEEAWRLHREALKQAATDPTSGQCPTDGHRPDLRSVSYRRPPTRPQVSVLQTATDPTSGQFAPRGWSRSPHFCLLVIITQFTLLFSDISMYLISQSILAFLLVATHRVHLRSLSISSHNSQATTVLLRALLWC